MELSVATLNPEGDHQRSAGDYEASKELKDFLLEFAKKLKIAS